MKLLLLFVFIYSAIKIKSSFAKYVKYVDTYYNDIDYYVVNEEKYNDNNNDDDNDNDDEDDEDDNDDEYDYDNNNYKERFNRLLKLGRSSSITTGQVTDNGFSRIDIKRNRGFEDLCFNYTSVNEWPELFSSEKECVCTKFADNFCFCDGPQKRQSPIDVRLNEVIDNCPAFTNEVRILELEFNLPESWIVENTDHNIELIPVYEDDGNSQDTPVIKFKNPFASNGLNKEYCFQQIHFHFASCNEFGGSEHLINGNAFVLEAHLVFHSCAFENVGDAIRQSNLNNFSDPDTLAVIALFFDNFDEIPNKQINNIFEEPNAVEDLKFSEEICFELGLDCEKTSSDRFNIAKLLPKNINNFYTYEGSLTTPGCTEIVRWFLLKNTVNIATKQLDKFFRNNIFATEYITLGNNFRPVQNADPFNLNEQPVFDCDLNGYSNNINKNNNDNGDNTDNGNSDNKKNDNKNDENENGKNGNGENGNDDNGISNNKNDYNGNDGKKKIIIRPIW